MYVMKLNFEGDLTVGNADLIVGKADLIVGKAKKLGALGFKYLGIWNFSDTFFIFMQCNAIFVKWKNPLISSR